MITNLYFQCLTQNQTANAVRMLKLISICSSSGKGVGRVKLSAEAGISRSQFSDLNALIGRLERKRFNQLEVSLTSAPRALAGISAPVISVNGVFSPSPTCSLWLPTRQWRLEADRSSRRQYMTAKNNEDIFRLYRIKRGPSIFEFVISLSDVPSRKALLDRCGEWLAEAFYEDLRSIAIFGSCDIGGAELTVELQTNVLMAEKVQIMANVKPSAYEKIGRRFENLHPIMFGSRRLCEGFARALKKNAKIMTAQHAANFAVLRVRNTDIATKQLEELMSSNFLLRPDDLLQGGREVGRCQV